MWTHTREYYTYEIERRRRKKTREKEREDEKTQIEHYVVPPHCEEACLLPLEFGSSRATNNASGSLNHPPPGHTYVAQTLIDESSN